jgi:hypothetical protein
VLVPPFVRSIVPALLTVTSCPLTAGVIAGSPRPPANSVLVESILSMPVSVPLLPSVRPLLSSVSWLPFVALMVDQFVKRLRPLA